MPKKSSTGLTRPQKTKTGTRKRNTKKVPRKSVPLAMLVPAIKDVHRTPPARIPSTHYGGPRRCHHPSIKTLMLQSKHRRDTYDHFYRVEGRLERAFCYRADIDPNIECYFPQPFEIDFCGVNGLSVYTPDFIVFPHDDKPYLVEVKHRDFMLFDDARDLYQLRAKTIKENTGIELQFPPEETLLRQPELENLELIHGFMFQPVHELKRSWKQVQKHLSRTDPVDMGELYRDNTLSPEVVAMGTSYGLFTGEAITNHNAPFGRNLTIYLER
ncbi:hypothetical protein [Spongiibacter marinus]|uniref:hypothetical protein n=1 Tax=Spongiibacter marinus TaxID=354246 RepID=UPI0035BE7B0A